MTTLPSGWKRTNLGSLGLYFNGRGFKKSEWRDHGRPIIRIQNLTGSSQAFNYFDGDADERYIARSGDLLVSWAATLGTYIWTGPEAVVNQHIFKVESNIDKTFHRYLLDFKLHALMRQTHGSGMVHITRGKFDSLPVIVPQSLEEQRRIVDILEDHLSRLDAAEADMNNAYRRASSLRTAVVRAELARFEGPQRTIHQLSESVRNGIFVSRAKAEPTGVPILRIGAVRPLSLDLGDLRYSERDELDLQREDSLLAPGDLLFTRYNGNPRFVGACAVVPENAGPLTYPDKLIRVRISAREAVPDYVALACTVGAGREQIHSHVKTTSGQAGISGRDLKTVTLVVPSIEHQQAVVVAAHERLDAVVELSKMISVSVRRCGSLRRSLLAAAFSGRLTGRISDMEMVEEMAGV